MSGEQLTLADALGHEPARDDGPAVPRPDGYERRQDELAETSPEMPAEHLTTVWPGDAQAKTNATVIRDDTEREFYCLECHRRVTRSATVDKEYGHAKACEHSTAVESGSQ